jgi:hypothetical protein
MKKLTLTLITIISLFCTNITESATRYITVFKKATGTTDLVVDIAANEVMFFDWLYSTGGQSKWIKVTKDGVEYSASSMSDWPTGGRPMFIAGPAKVEVYTSLTDSKIYFSGRIEPNPNIGGVGQ